MLLIQWNVFFKEPVVFWEGLLAIVFLLDDIERLFRCRHALFFPQQLRGRCRRWNGICSAIVILFGVSVALLEEGHVGSIFSMTVFRCRKKAVINIIGTVFFLLPLACLILFRLL